MSDLEGYMNMKDLAEHLTVSVSTIRAWMRNKVIPKDTYISLGTTYRFKASAVTDALMNYNLEKEESPQIEMDFNQAVDNWDGDEIPDEISEADIEEDESNEDGPFKMYDPKIN